MDAFAQRISLGALVSLFAMLSGFLLAFQGMVSYAGLLIICCVALAAISFRDKTEWLIPVLFFLIPISIPVQIHGIGMMSFPTEIIIPGIIAIAFLLFLAGRPVLLKVVMHPLTILLILDLIWTLFTLIYSELPVVSAKRFMMKSIFFCGFYLVMIHWFEDKKRLGTPFFAYAMAMVPVVIFMIYFFLNHGFSASTAFAASQPFFSDHTIFGAATAFLFPGAILLIINRNKLKLNAVWMWASGLSGLILGLGIFLSQSRAAWLSVIAVIIVYLLLHLGIRFWGLMIITASFLVLGISGAKWIYPAMDEVSTKSNQGSVMDQWASLANWTTDPSNLERLNRYHCALKMLKERPFSGYGPGTYQFVYGGFQKQANLTSISTFKGDRGNAHSELFSYLSENGIPGCLIFFGIAFYSIWLGMKLYYRVSEPWIKLLACSTVLGLVSFYVHSLVNSFLDQDEMASLYYTSIALLAGIDIFHQKFTNIDFHK